MIDELAKGGARAIVSMILHRVFAGPDVQTLGSAQQEETPLASGLAVPKFNEVTLARLVGKLDTGDHDYYPGKKVSHP